MHSHENLKDILSKIVVKTTTVMVEKTYMLGPVIYFLVDIGCWSNRNFDGFFDQVAHLERISKIEDSDGIIFRENFCATLLFYQPCVLQF